MKKFKDIPLKSIYKLANNLSVPSIVLISTETLTLEQFVNAYINLGFKVYKQGGKRKYILFGQKKYFCILVADKGYYEKSLQAAVQMEHYEKAAEFKRKLDELAQHNANIKK